MKKVCLLLALLIALPAGGCVITLDPVKEERFAKRHCEHKGFKEHTKSYDACAAQFRAEREAYMAEANARMNAVVAASVIEAAGMIGAAAIEADRPVYYPYPPYYRCHYYGCW
jgi:hypothetical protein